MASFAARASVIRAIAGQGELAHALMTIAEREAARALVAEGHVTKGRSQHGGVAYFRGHAPTWEADAQATIRHEVVAGFLIDVVPEEQPARNTFGVTLANADGEHIAYIGSCIQSRTVALQAADIAVALLGELRRIEALPVAEVQQ